MYLSTIWMCLAIVLLMNGKPLSADIACVAWLIHRIVEIKMQRQG
jgi:hypothetical protein